MDDMDEREKLLRLYEQEYANDKSHMLILWLFLAGMLGVLVIARIVGCQL